MKLVKFFACGLLITSLLCCCAQQKNRILKTNPDNNSLLWRVSGKDLKEPSFLFGTFHLLCKDDIHFSRQFTLALQASTEVYMELNLDDPSTMLGGLLFINMKNGKKLSDLYTPAEYKSLLSYFNDSLHTPLVMMEKIKPYFLVAMLYPRMMECKTISGVEEELMKLAKENNKKFKGFETVEFQASVFDSIPYDWQAKELMKNIDSFPFYKKQFDTMINAYLEQDLDELTAVLGKSEFGSEKYEDLLLTKRNVNWVQKLNTIMNKESVFVAVGAGHLLGPKGLIALLQSEGYKVEPLINK